ncbi:MAG: glycosyltransferase [Bacteroidota bacterium]
MKKVEVDVLVIALNKIEYDARLSNFIDTFDKNGLRIATVTLDDYEFVKSKENRFRVEVRENIKTIAKVVDFLTAGKNFLEFVVPKYVLCSDVYSLPLGVKFKKKYNAKLIYDSREIYSALASLNEKPFKQFVLKYFERINVKNVDAIIVTGDLDKEYLSKLFPKKRIEVVYNYPKKIDTLKPVDLRKKFGLSEKNILAIYQGVLLKGRGIELCVSSLKYAEELHLIIAGSGSMEKEYQDLAKNLALDERVHFLGQIPYEKLLQYTSGCDVGLCLIEPISFSYKLALPNKLFEYVQAGIPVLATNLPAISRVFKSFRIGELVEPNVTPKDLSEAIVSVASNKEQYRMELEKCSELFVWEQQEKIIMDLVK